MIPSLSAMTARLGVNTTYLPLVFVGLVTGFVFLVQVVDCCFEDRNP